MKTVKDEMKKQTNASLDMNLVDGQTAKRGSPDLLVKTNSSVKPHRKKIDDKKAQKKLAVIAAVRRATDSTSSSNNLIVNKPVVVEGGDNLSDLIKQKLQRAQMFCENVTIRGYRETQEILKKNVFYDSTDYAKIESLGGKVK